MKIYLTGQNNFGNRGCEALVRSTIAVLRRRWPDATFLVPSLDIERDSRQWPDAAAHGVEWVKAPSIGRRFIHWNRVVSRLPALAALPWPGLAADDPLRQQLASCDLLLSIGGDNYALDYGLASLAFFVAVAEAAMQAGKPAVLWGASVGPFSRLPAVEKKMVKHLGRLQAVTVRESHSLNYLRGLGLNANLHAVVDSAFVLDKEAVADLPWPQAGADGVLGLNLSPLVDKVRQQAGAARPLADEAIDFLRRVLAETDMGVLLVPHVAPLDGSERNNDERYMAALLERLGDSGGRVVMLPGGLNAIQLKGAISRCQAFIGARTHATIAAMSTAVPTVSIAYSVKALGINRDLFGDERYVLDTRTLDAAALWSALQGLRADRSAIDQLYAEQLPEWRERASSGLLALERSGV